ncbi:MAG TPA: aldo/keto reductase [Steroidobacteraceae bacterium]
MIDLTLSNPLGSTNLTVGGLGLGVAPLGNLFTPVSDTDAQDTLTAAERLGISWFDVAPYYGFGLAETRLGQFLSRSKAVRRTISTKVGRILLPTDRPPAHPQYVAASPNQPVFDYTRAGIVRSYQDSLKRLGVDRVEILLLHDVDRVSHPHGHRQLVRDLLREGLPALQRLKAEGAVDAIGLGINEWDIGYEIVASAEIDCVLLAGRYTLLDHTAFASGFLDTCSRRGVSVLAGGVFNSGFLAGGAHYAYGAADRAHVEAREALLTICRRYDVELPAVALQFTGAHPAITSVVVGARSANEVDAICRWSQVEIPTKLWSDLRHAKLIPADAPVPLG